MTAARATVLFAVLASAAVEAAVPCGAALTGERRLVENASYQVAFRTSVDPVPTGRYFAVDFAVCPRGNAAVPTDVRVDANMPEHRHGMNYRPEVTRISPGVYRAEGLLFHMPGRWDLTFDIVTGGAVQRLAATLHVE
ncbi:MAG TPA: FixH family protein [Casimicrobiaceae bacterium]|nr:FixH family protein [Casimicrobiaceae bacterium]